MKIKYIIKVGQIFTLNCGDQCEVIKVEGKEITVKFTTGNTKIVVSGDLRSGKIRNPLYPTYYNFGFEGIGEFSIYMRGGNGKKTPEGKLWSDMLARCYSKARLDKQPHYNGCTIQDSWRNFQHFAKWCQVTENFNTPNWQLDKDILIIGNRVYSEHTCMFVPAELNKFFKSHTKNFNVIKRGENYSSKVYLKGVQTYSPKYRTFKDAANWYLENKNNELKLVVEKYKLVLKNEFLNKVENGYYVKL